jgi:hypothetical protein
MFRRGKQKVSQHHALSWGSHIPFSGNMTICLTTYVESNFIGKEEFTSGKFSQINQSVGLYP